MSAHYVLQSYFSAGVGVILFSGEMGAISVNLKHYMHQRIQGKSFYSLENNTNSSGFFYLLFKATS